ncbi:MAG: NAD(P)/FAD-dependent oxidoreductase [Nitrososphaerales archaeon]
MVQRLALVGSGTGGTFAANLLSTKLRERVHAGEVQILLVGEGFRHHFQPANLDVAFKGAHPDDHSRSEMDLLKPEVTFIPDPAERIDLENRRILTVGGDAFDYDQVILATGAEASPGMIPGLAEGSVNFHAGPNTAMKVWDSVRNFKKGRIGVIIAGEPHKCPPSPDAALFLLDEYLRHRGIRNEVELTLLTPHPKPYPADNIAEVVAPLFEKRGIKTEPSFTVESVDPSAKKAYSREGDEYAYDLLIAIPPHRGARVVRESGFGDEEGWIRVDRRRMMVEGHDDAFGVGDATNIPVYKSGVAAYLESKVVAANMAAEILGEEREWEYDGRISSPMELGHRRAIVVSATYQRPTSVQAPSVVNYAMKRGFDAIYWSILSCKWEWVMNAYFGQSSGEAAKGAQQSAPQQSAPQT